jgi:ribonuclease HI
MVATVYTDGSYLADNKVGGYAYWVKTHKGQHQLSRLCPADMDDITLCEAYGIYQAIGHTLHYYPCMKQINLFSDSKGAIELLSAPVFKWKGDRTRQAIAKRLYVAYAQLLNRHTIVINMQYRPQHSRKHGNGKQAQDWCNMMARQVTLTEVEQRHALPRIAVKGPGVGTKGLRKVG